MLPLTQIAADITLGRMFLHPKYFRWPGAPLCLLLALTIWMAIITVFATLLEPSALSYLNLVKIVFMTCILARS